MSCVFFTIYININIYIYVYVYIHIILACHIIYTIYYIPYTTYYVLYTIHEILHYIMLPYSRKWFAHIGGRGFVARMVAVRVQRMSRAWG